MPNNEMKYTITENAIYELSSRLDTAEKRIKYKKLDVNILTLTMQKCKRS